MKIAIIVNDKRKDSAELDEAHLNSIAQKNNVEYTLFLKPHQEIEETTKEILKQNYHAVIVAGGDGSVRSAVQAMVGQEIPLAILALGTFNYYARELQYPKDMDSLFKIIKNNKVKLVDVGEVNNTVFINHCSIGFYSRILKLKEKHDTFFGNNKLLKVIFTAVNLFKVLPIYQLKMLVDGQEIIVRTCLIFIGNNYFFTDLLNFGERKSLTTGELAISILKCKNRWEVFKCIFNNLFNTEAKDEYIIQYTTKHLSITAKSKLVYIVIDGDLFKMDVPLEYTIHNKQLPVFTP